MKTLISIFKNLVILFLFSSILVCTSCGDDDDSSPSGSSNNSGGTSGNSASVEMDGTLETFNSASIQTSFGWNIRFSRPVNSSQDEVLNIAAFSALNANTPYDLSNLSVGVSYIDPSINNYIADNGTITFTKFDTANLIFEGTFSGMSYQRNINGDNLDSIRFTNGKFSYTD